MEYSHREVRTSYRKKREEPTLEEKKEKIRNQVREFINRTGKSSATMKALKDILGEIGVSSEGSNNSNVDITIIIGKDYNK